jgi:hypothetical protein
VTGRVSAADPQAGGVVLGFCFLVGWFLHICALLASTAR